MVDVENILVLGAGLMGSGIAQVSLMAGYNVTLVDIKQEFVDKGASGVENGIKKLESKGKLGEGVTADDIMARLSKSISLEDAVKNADIVIEAVVERMDIKKQVCKTVMDNGPDHVIFASNTSTMSITEIGKDSGAPDRVCGMHFFNPVPLMRLIEVIRGEDTSDDTFEKTMAIAETLPCLRGDRYIAPVLKDRPGFIVNRMNAPVQIYLSWCFDQAAKKGLDWAQLDADAGGKMPMPPCMLTDFVGIDTMVHVMNYYKETLSPDFEPGETITKLNEEGNLGQKTGKGFYDWSEGKDPIKSKIKEAEPAGLFDLFTTFAIMLNEGCRILDEGIASGYKIIDDANMAGMNAPGPFGAGKKNYEDWSKLLDNLADKTGKDYFRPIELMKTGGFKKMRK
ncbi:MAG: 3-hydroxyacyl-CoA dehydrogenase family protein [Candidatus Lokiarchaeota archaeon]|nr:3-hydroxyacyl-CoA dehydrogenase family protein [Candidatus Lokiarchaeota archaeon]MBD3198968.1 3-hydroxyacyl-CoA dehydrogenase family protein [Candidatus Lokiarchaeota archaeon]